MFDINYNNFKKILSDDRVLKDMPMSKLTSFRIGGNADVVCVPKSADEIIACIGEAKTQNLPYYIIGNGSNILVRDKGLRGVVIKILDGMDEISIEDDLIVAQAGAKLSSLSRFCTDNSYVGMEFAFGIPGTVGGGLFMNAGAYGSELKDCVVWAEVINENLEIVTYTLEDMKLEYRNSAFQRNKCIITKAGFKLDKGNKEESQKRIEELTNRRRASQPLKYPSAGSTFKRPVGGYAAQLIDEAGLKGLTVGGAMVSTQHAGFVINNGNATANDVLELVDMIIEKVKEASGITLEPEIRIIGEN
jgi:UDP-N-acetylmuramate dehydrogenase